jgi:hypothetical protein
MEAVRAYWQEQEASIMQKISSDKAIQTDEEKDNKLEKKSSLFSFLSCCNKRHTSPKHKKRFNREQINHDDIKNEEKIIKQVHI